MDLSSTRPERSVYTCDKQEIEQVSLLQHRIEESSNVTNFTDTENIILYTDRNKGIAVDTIAVKESETYIDDNNMQVEDLTTFKLRSDHGANQTVEIVQIAQTAQTSQTCQVVYTNRNVGQDNQTKDDDLLKECDTDNESPTVNEPIKDEVKAEMTRDGNQRLGRYKYSDKDISKFWEADIFTLYVYKCDVCELRVLAERDLWKHRQEEHSSLEMTSFMTEVCKYILKETRSIINNRCHICGDKLLGTDRLWHHRLKRHADLSVVCQKCDFVGLDEESVILHNKEEHQETEDVEAGNKNMHYNTAVKEEGEKNVSKDETLRREKIKRKKAAKKETSKNQSKKLYSCNNCDFVGTINKYKRHVRMTHCSTEKQFCCDVCDFTAKRMQVVRNHKRVQHEGVRFQCDKCPFQAKSALALKTHKSTKHGIGDSFPCEQCGYRAPNRGRLNFHIKTIHEGASFPCPHCDFTSNLKGSLKNHLASQHGDKVYLCDKCDYRAALKENLKTHIEVKHKGIKYPCNLCNFEASYTNDLRKHIRTVHEGVKYHCKHCDFTATRKFAVTQHTKRVHPTVTEVVLVDVAAAQFADGVVTPDNRFSSVKGLNS